MNQVILRRSVVRVGGIWWLILNLNEAESENSIDIMSKIDCFQVKYGPVQK